jgi:hypothetical protein
MAPVFQAAGTAQSGINALTVAWPSHLTNDIGILVIETGGEGTTLSITAPTGWAAITGSPVTDVTTTSGSKLQVWWKRAASAAETSVTVPDSGDHQVARIYTFRGCITTGDPWDVATTGNKTTASTTATVPSLTTAVQDTLVVAIIGRPDDSASTTHFGTLTNANLTGIASAGEAGTQSGHGGGFVLEYGAFLGPGSTGTSTATKTASTTDTYMALALRAPLRALSLVSNAGAFALTGKDANLLENRRLVADKGTLTETGVAAGLARGFRLTADKGTFTETGRDANLTRTRLLLASAGAVTLSGRDANLTRARLLTGDFAKYFLPERNLRPWSEAFDNATWTKTNASVSANITTAPDGTLTADALIENTTQSVGHQVGRNITYVSGSTYTASCYFKVYPGPITRYVRLQLGNATVFGTDCYINVNLAAGTITTTSGSPSATSITNEGNGWYRASLTKQYTGAGVTASPTISLISTTGSALYTDADGLSGIYLWGAQFEEGSLSAYDPTGPAAAAITNTRVTRRLVADKGTLTLTGRDANLIHNARLLSAAGSFTLSGNAAGLARGFNFTAAAGAFSLTGNAATLIKTGASAFTAQPGAFTLSGQPATLRATRSLTAAAGSFALTGNTANLARGVRLIAAAGSFAETGQPATLRATRRLLSAAGAFTLSGQSAGFLGQRYLPLAPGAFTATGNAATLRVTRALAAATGSIALTGNAATLSKTTARTVVAEPGAFALTGQPAALRRGYSLLASAGAFTLSGKSAGFLGQRYMALDPGSFALSGASLTVQIGRAIAAANGTYLYTGQTAMIDRRRRRRVVVIF